VANWRTGGLAEWRNWNGGDERRNGGLAEMAEWRNWNRGGGTVKWRNGGGGTVNWRTDRMVEWRNGRMAEWLAKYWDGRNGYLPTTFMVHANDTDTDTDTF
jgi:hypothetical protein